MSGHSTLEDWVLAGEDAPAAHEAAAIAHQIGIDLSRDVDDRQRRRAAAGSDRPRAGAGPRRAVARRADQSSRSWRDRLAGGLAASASRARSSSSATTAPSSPRLTKSCLWLDRGRDATRRNRLRRVRCLDRGHLCRGAARGRQARRQAGARASLAAAWRDRAAAAQPGPAGQAQRDARPAGGDAGARRRRQARPRQGRCEDQDGDRCRACLRNPSATARSSATSRCASSAATASAWSAPTAPARRRC